MGLQGKTLARRYHLVLTVRLQLSHCTRALTACGPPLEAAQKSPNGAAHHRFASSTPFLETKPVHPTAHHAQRRNLADLELVSVEGSDVSSSRTEGSHCTSAPSPPLPPPNLSAALVGDRLTPPPDRPGAKHDSAQTPVRLF